MIKLNVELDRNQIYLLSHLLGKIKVVGAENLIKNTKTEFDRILQIYHSADLNNEFMNEMYERTKDLPEIEISEEENAYLDYLDDMEIYRIKTAAFLDYKNGEMLIKIKNAQADKG